MLDWLDRQRRKSKEARRRVAFLIAAGATAVVVLIWVVSLPARFSNIETPRTETPNEGREMFNGFNTLIEEGRNELENTARQLEESPDTNPEPNEEPVPERPQIPDRPSAFDTAAYGTSSSESGDGMSSTSATNTP